MKKTILKIAIIVFALLLLFSLSTYTWYIGVFVGLLFSAMPFLISIITLIIGIIIFVTRKKILLALYSLMIIITIILSFFIGSYIGELKEKNTAKNAEEVIVLLESYKIKHNEYPENILLLFSDFPDSKVKFKNITYNYINGKEYELFLNTTNCGKIYINRTTEQKWDSLPCLP
ncbi:MAG: hypothetical protein V1892_02130 [bacterium]